MGGSNFTITVVNTTEHDSGFDLYRLHPQTSYADWVASHAELQAILDGGGDAGSHRDLDNAVPIDLQEAVEPGGTGSLAIVHAEAGTYALQCWLFPAEGTMKVVTAGPIVVD